MALSTVALSLLLSFSIKFSVGDQDFSYDGNHGPSHWAEEYQSCVGKHQSPINIEEHNVRNINLPPLTYFGLNTPRYSIITNNGHTVMIKTNESETAMVHGGPLGNETYIFEQLHFHWGQNDREGSEDLINNHSFAMELHAVFYKKEYKSMKEAMKYSDGLAVFAYFYEVANDNKPNPTYNSIVDALSKIEMVNSKYDIEEPLLLERLLIPNESSMQNYFTYNGSLTTPPCSEVVTWIDFKKPQLLSHQQLAAFRDVRTSDGTKLTHNFRPVQPLADRLVFHNIPSVEDNTSNISHDIMHHSNTQHSSQNVITSSVFLISTMLAIVSRPF